MIRVFQTIFNKKKPEKEKLLNKIKLYKKKVIVFSTLIIYLLLSVPLALASYLDKVINPQRYHSLNNEFNLNIIPSSRNGAGSARYRFQHKNKLMWEKNLDFTLVDTNITSQGDIVGYAYNQGLNGMGEQSQLILAIINKKGQLKFKKSLTRDEPSALHSPTTPVCNGILLQEQYDKAIFRIHDDETRREKWIAVSLTTGQEKSSISPELKVKSSDSKTLDSAFIKHVIAFSNQPYFLLSLHGYNYITANDVIYTHLSNSLFFILDKNGKTIWYESNPDDLDYRNNGLTKDQISNYLKQRHLINYDNKTKSFSVSHLGNDENISYQISTQGKIIEVERTHSELFTILFPDKNDTSNNITSSSLFSPKYLYSIPLINEFQTSEKSLPKHIRFFDFDETENIGTVSRETSKSGSQYFFYFIDQSNQLINKFPLKISLQNLSISAITYYGKKQWLVLASNYQKEAALFLVNQANQSVREIPINAPGAGRMVVDSRGNITLLTTKGENYLQQIKLSGKVLWTFQVDSSEPGGILSPEDIAITHDDNILVLDNIAQKINIYSRTGKFLKTVQFHQTKSGEISYPTLIDVGKNGMIYVLESAEPFRLHQYTTAGFWYGSIILSTATGRQLSYLNDMQFDHNNNLWLAKTNVYQLKGTQVKRLGSNDQERLFDSIVWMETDSAGNLYLFNHETYSIIRFKNMSQPGNKVPDVFSLPEYEIPVSYISGRQMFIDAEDKINLNLEHGRYAVFDPKGKQLPHKKLDSLVSNSNIDNLIAQKNAPAYWIESHTKIRLVTFNNKGIKDEKMILKDSNGDWLANIYEIFTDHQGRLLARANHGPLFSNSSSNIDQNILYLFGQSGESIATIPVKIPQIAGLTFSENTIYISSFYQKQIMAIDLSGRVVASFPPADKLPKQYSRPYLLSADKKTNKLYALSKTQLHVFELSDHKLK